MTRIPTKILDVALAGMIPFLLFHNYNDILPIESMIVLQVLAVLSIIALFVLGTIHNIS